jgi:hypothetical protein
MLFLAGREKSSMPCAKVLTAVKCLTALCCRSLRAECLRRSTTHALRALTAPLRHGYQRCSYDSLAGRPQISRVRTGGTGKGGKRVWAKLSAGCISGTRCAGAGLRRSPMNGRGWIAIPLLVLQWWDSETVGVCRCCIGKTEGWKRGK